MHVKHTKADAVVFHPPVRPAGIQAISPSLYEVLRSMVREQVFERQRK